jgi:hypothetical protein
MKCPFSCHRVNPGEHQKIWDEFRSLISQNKRKPRARTTVNLVAAERISCFLKISWDRQIYCVLICPLSPQTRPSNIFRDTRRLFNLQRHPAAVYDELEVVRMRKQRPQELDALARLGIGRLRPSWRWRTGLRGNRARNQYANASWNWFWWILYPMSVFYRRMAGAIPLSAHLRRL